MALPRPSLAAVPGSAANEPYIVGVVVSESGPAATLGRPAADSITMAVVEINAAGGVNGHPIQLTILDDQSDPTTAVNALRKLLDMHPIAVIGSSGTPPSLARVPVANAAGVPLISLGSSSAIIDPATDHWIFKIPVADTYIAQRLLTSMKLRGFTRIGVVTPDRAVPPVCYPVGLGSLVVAPQRSNTVGRARMRFRDIA